jgi:hypothetical protein
MPDVPFFRGPNRFDWLFAVTLQTAVDWGSSASVHDVLSVLGDSEASTFTDTSGFFPKVVVATTDDFVFVVSASTKGAVQWFGNVLGSAAIPFAGLVGSVAEYFGKAAGFQYGACRSLVLSRINGRRLVLIGFSLGGATTTLLKELFLNNDGIPSACVAFGCPRPGTVAFADGYPVSDYEAFTIDGDPVSSVAPALWAALGNHNAWLPFPPLAAFSHVVDGWTLKIDGSIDPGLPLVDVTTVVTQIADGSIQSFHNQALYARSLRKQILPDVIPDGFDGYPHAGMFDKQASMVFSYDGTPWHWYGATVLKGGSGVTIQLTVGVRDRGSVPLAFDEVYYVDGNNPLSVLNAFLGTNSPSAKPIVQRTLFLSKSAEIYYVRANVVGAARGGYLRKMKTPAQGVTGVTESLSTSIVYFGYNNDRTAKRQFHFRGIDANWITADALTGTGDKGLTQIETFLGLMKGIGLGVLSENVGIPDGLQIAGAAKATQDSNIVLTLADGVTVVPAGALVKITGCRQAPLLNATWKVAGTPIAGQFTLGTSARFSCPAVINGVVRRVDLVLQDLGDVEYNNVGDKKCGRPRFLRRGKRSVQIRRR